MTAKTHAIGGLMTAVVITSLVGCSSKASTPEAAFDNLKATMKAKDYKTGLSQMMPDTQDYLLEGIVTRIGATVASDPAQGAEIKKIAEKYGLKIPTANEIARGNDPMLALKQAVADVKDKPACFAEIVQWYAANRPNEPIPTTGIEAIGDATLDDLKTEGDKSSGNIKWKNVDFVSSQPVTFNKIGGAWYIDIPPQVNATIEGGSAKK